MGKILLALLLLLISVGCVTVTYTSHTTETLKAGKVVTRTTVEERKTVGYGTISAHINEGNPPSVEEREHRNRRQNYFP